MVYGSFTKASQIEKISIKITDLRNTHPSNILARDIWLFFALRSNFIRIATLTIWSVTQREIKIFCYQEESESQIFCYDQDLSLQTWWPIRQINRLTFTFFKDQLRSKVKSFVFSLAKKYIYFEICKSLVFPVKLINFAYVLWGLLVWLKFDFGRKLFLQHFQTQHLLKLNNSLNAAKMKESRNNLMEFSKSINSRRKSRWIMTGRIRRAQLWKGLVTSESAVFLSVHP